MANKTGIEWTDSTWSPIRVRVKADAAQIARDKGYTSLVQIAEKMAGRVGPHCEHVSPGCENCYAATNNHRCLPANGTGLPYDRRARDLVEAFVDEKILLQPLQWKPIKQECTYCFSDHLLRNCPENVTRPRRIFVENQSDLFGEWVTDELRDRVFAVMALCPQHEFQVLTKRTSQCWDYWFLLMRSSRLFYIALAIDDLIPQRTKASIAAKERLFGANPLRNVIHGFSAENQNSYNVRWRAMERLAACGFSTFASCEPLLGAIDMGKERKPDWVVAGGESGSGARPMHPEWARSLRDQCKAAGVAFFFKQNGEYASVSAVEGSGAHHQFVDGATVRRVGKKAAGALLDGVEYKQFPEAKI